MRASPTAISLTIALITLLATRSDGQNVTQLWATSHPTDFYISHLWDGTYWSLKGYASNGTYHAPVKVGFADIAASANALGGIDISRVVYGGNSTKSTNTSDFNTQLPSGFYSANNATGLPDAGFWTVLNQSHYDAGNYGSQLAVSYARGPSAEPMIKLRIVDNGTYGSWYNILSQSGAVKTAPLYLGDLNSNHDMGGRGVTGMYMFNADPSATATPLNNWAHVIEMQHDAGNNWTGQIALDYFGGGMYWRQQGGPTWNTYSAANNGWQEVASKGWVQSQMGNTAAGNYLPLAGGSISGNLGIGTASPQARLHVLTDGSQLNAPNGPYTGDMIVQASTATRNMASGASLEFVLPANADGSNLWGQARIMATPGNQNNGDATGRLVLGTRRSPNGAWIYGNDITIDGSGNVGIGTLDTKGYLLAVAGNMVAQKLVVKQQQNWPDYVFDTATYKLAPLADVEGYIQKNGHLSEMPSAAEVQKEGLDLAATQGRLLQKIEELTLYIISQDKKQRAQDKLIAGMKKELDLIKNKQTK